MRRTERHLESDAHRLLERLTFMERRPDQLEIGLHVVALNRTAECPRQEAAEDLLGVGERALGEIEVAEQSAVAGRRPFGVQRAFNLDPFDRQAWTLGTLRGTKETYLRDISRIDLDRLAGVEPLDDLDDRGFLGRNFAVAGRTRTAATQPQQPEFADQRGHDDRPVGASMGA